MEKLRVLVVDDEPGIRAGVKRILRNYTIDYPFMDENFGFEIIEAATGEEAVAIIDKQPPDIALLDNKLPGISGMEVLSHIHKKKYDIQVMMITSYASLELAVQATQKGAYDFVPKPFTPKELKASMENITKHLFLLRMTKNLNKEGKQIRFQFLSVLSHEMKAPLNAIEGYLRMIKEKEFGDNVDDYQTMVERSIARVKGMRHLIMDLLDLTRIEQGQQKRTLISVELEEIAKMAIDTMVPYAIQKDIKINLNVIGDTKLEADEKEIEIIFNNLVSNAIKYNKQGGKVDINISSDGEKHIVKVSDTGIGMTPEETAKLFGEFVRIKNTKTKNINGSGLGLSILKKTISMYGGDVSVESEPDKGTSFTVTFPFKV